MIKELEGSIERKSFAILNFFRLGFSCNLFGVPNDTAVRYSRNISPTSSKKKVKWYSDFKISDSNQVEELRL